MREVVTWHAVAEIRIFVACHELAATGMFCNRTSTCYLYCRVLAKVVADIFPVNI